MKLNELIDKLKNLPDKGKAAALDWILRQRFCDDDRCRQCQPTLNMLENALAAGEGVKKE